MSHDCHREQLQEVLAEVRRLRSHVDELLELAYARGREDEYLEAKDREQAARRRNATARTRARQLGWQQ